MGLYKYAKATYMKYFLFFLFSIASLAIYAQDPANERHYLVDLSTLSNYGIDTMKTIPYGVPIGSHVENFMATDYSGKTFSLYDALETGPVVLVFYRGHWCGICNKYLKSLEQSLESLKSFGAQIVAITPETDDGVRGTIDNTSVSFPIISDDDHNIIDQFDVKFYVTEVYDKRVKSSSGMTVGENNDDADAILPVPATYIIGKDKKVHYRHFDPNYRKRMSVEDIAKYLQEM